MVDIAILGHGVNGSGVVEVLSSHREAWRRAPERKSYQIYPDLVNFPDSPFADRFTKDFEQIVNDPDVRVVVEVMGDSIPAF